MKYSIIIPTYNHLNDCLKPCVESLIKFTDFTDVELIIVANGCKDGTREYLQSLKIPNLKTIWFDEPLGYTIATNVGIRASRGEFVILLNNDCVMLNQERNTWIKQLVEPFEKRNDIGITGASKLYSRDANYDFVIFFCAMMRRSMIDRIGLLEERFTPGGGEDIDYAAKVQNLGYRVMEVPDDRLFWTHSTYFPIYHAAESTVHGVEGWEASFQKNMQTVSKLHKKPIKHSLVIPLISMDDEKLLLAIRQNTCWSEMEAIGIVCAEDPRVSDMAHRLTFNGPWTIIDAYDRTYGAALRRGLDIAKGEVTIFLHPRIMLLDSRWNIWREMLVRPFENAQVAVTGPIACQKDTRYISFVTAAVRTQDAKKFPEPIIVGKSMCDFLTRQNKMIFQIGAAAPVPNVPTVVGGFPMYYQGVMDTI